MYDSLRGELPTLADVVKSVDWSRAPETISTAFCTYSCTYGRDEDDTVYVTVRYQLPADLYAEIEDGTYGVLQGFRYYYY